MTTEDDLRQERDEVFIRHIAAGTRNSRSEFREWIQAELKDLILKAQALEPVLPEVAKNVMQEHVQRMTDIDNHELTKSIRTLDEEIQRIAEGAYDDILDAHWYLQDQLSRVERLVRQVLDIRRRILDLWGSYHEPAE